MGLKNVGKSSIFMIRSVKTQKPIYHIMNLLTLNNLFFLSVAGNKML